MLNPDDTIVALASTSGPGLRGIVRLSGMRSRSAIAAYFTPLPETWPAKRVLLRGQLRLPELDSPLPADLYFAPSPRTYTGQDTAELHLISSLPLLDALIAALLKQGLRAAEPGEFTLRAFLNGKKDLTQAEAVLAVIEAQSSDELKQSLAQLAGGLTLPLHDLRNDLLNLLADIEAGLDFSEEDIQFVNKPNMLLRLAKGLAQLTNLTKQLDTRAVSQRPFRVVLIGEPNAGKSSLFNALAGLPASLVSAAPGTTRDYVSRSVRLGDLAIELIDTAGWQHTDEAIGNQAQALGEAQATKADLLLWCVPADSPLAVSRSLAAPIILVRTKADLGKVEPEAISTSVKSGAGVGDLKALLAQRALTFARPALAPSLSRCQHHVDEALKHLRAAHALVLFDDPAELLALELRLALDQIGEMVGAIYTDDLLDRIFTRFCIGK